MKNFLLMLAVLTVWAPLSVPAADARREAARLAAQRAEEATRSAQRGGAPAAASSAGAASAQPARPAAQPPAVDEDHVEIVSAGAVPLHGAGDLIGNRYLLREIDGEAVAEDAAAFFAWRSGTEMSGTLCAAFRAECSFENTVVKAEPIPVATGTACDDEAMGAVEERVFAALKLGMSFLAVGDSLEMRRDDLVLRFTLDREERAEEESGAVAEAEEETEEDVAEEAPAGDGAEAEEPAPEPEPAAEEDESDSEPIVSEPIVVVEDLIDRKFVLAKVDGEDFAVASGRQPFIEFGEGMRVGGSACNTFTGLGALTDGRLIVANAVATRMMCVDGRVSEFERYFHRMLREGVELALDGGTLILTGSGRTLEFTEEK